MADQIEEVEADQVETRGGKSQTLKLWLSRLGSGFEKIAAILAVILAWEFVTRSGLTNPFLLPPFSVVIIKLAELFASGEMIRDIAASLSRSFAGFVLAATVAVSMGIFMGWFKRLDRIVTPLVEICRNTPILALYPIFILLLGLGEASKVAIIFWGSLWPALINTIEGVKSVDPLLIKSARSMGVSTTTLFRKVILPAATPAIITGLRLSATLSIIILVAAEMLNANAGLGFMIFYYEDKYRTPEMYAGIITIAALGFLINYLLVKLENRLTIWKQRETDNKPVKVPQKDWGGF